MPYPPQQLAVAVHARSSPKQPAAPIAAGNFIGEEEAEELGEAGAAAGEEPRLLPLLTPCHMMAAIAGGGVTERQQQPEEHKAERRCRGYQRQGTPVCQHGRLIQRRALGCLRASCVGVVHARRINVVVCLLPLNNIAVVIVVIVHLRYGDRSLLLDCGSCCCGGGGGGGGACIFRSW